MQSHYQGRTQHRGRGAVTPASKAKKIPKSTKNCNIFINFFLLKTYCPPLEFWVMYGPIVPKCYYGLPVKVDQYFNSNDYVYTRKGIVGMWATCGFGFRAIYMNTPVMLH